MTDKGRKCFSINQEVLDKFKRLSIKIYGGTKYMSRYAEDLFKKEIKSQEKKGK
jgi:hypothetical protein